MIYAINLSSAFIPNPARGLFNIEVYNSDEIVGAVIYDATGRKVQEIPVHIGINTVSTDAIASGVYILRITDSKGISKVTKNHCRKIDIDIAFFCLTA
jgi:hypothetical protein